MGAPDRFEVVEPQRAFDEMGAEWGALLEESAADTLFLTPEWLRAWWSVYGAARLPRILLASRRGNLAGILPLQLMTERYRGILPLRSLRFLGDGTYDSDYLDFVLPRGEEALVLSAFGSWLDRGAAAPKYDLIRWNELPVASPSYGILRGHSEQRGTFLEEERIGCVVAELPDSWERYVASLKPRMRTKVRALRRELEARHSITLMSCGTEEALRETLASLFELHERRWATRGERGVFQSDQKRAFYHVIGRVLLERGWLALHTLTADGRPVAHQFCGVYKGRAYLLQEGYDPDWEAMGVGNVLRAMSMERLIEGGVRAYDFLGGVSSHKLSWGGTVHESARMVLRGQGLRAAVVAGVTRLAEFSAPIRAAWRRGAR